MGMDDYLAANKALWEEWTAIHETSSFYDLEGFKAGGSRLRTYEVDEVGEVTGKSLLHLQFDVVYTSHGVLGWLPDLERWAGVVAHFRARVGSST
jgi:hypothetical protein